MHTSAVMALCSLLMRQVKSASTFVFFLSYDINGLLLQCMGFVFIVILICIPLRSWRSAAC